MNAGDKLHKEKNVYSKQRKCSNCRKCVVEKFKAYCRNTSLHGLNYVENEKLSTFERLFFLLAFIIAFIVLLNFVSNVYVKWTENPVIIGISSVPISIKRIPFPAITICNMNQARASKVVNITRNSSEYSVLQALCSHSDTESFATWEAFENLILKVSQPCNQLIVSCKFGRDQDNCTRLFKPILSDEGLCCSFNSAHETIMYKNSSKIPLNSRSTIGNLTLVNWTLQRGYPKDKHGNFYPQPAAGVGRNLGLNIVLDAEINDYYCSSSNGPGFKVLLHNPNEAPNVENYGVPVQAGEETQFVIEPDISDASPVLRDLAKDKRLCLFNSESTLVYYAKYLTRNCELEFEALQLAKKCKCLLYYMPRVDPDLKICGATDMACYRDVLLCNNKKNCTSNCLPGCFELKFLSSKTSSPLRQKKFAIRNKMLQSIPAEYAINNMAVLHFYYIDNAFRGKTKEQYVGITDFVANTGGLLGLFMGFSAISLVEIFYYTIFKPFIDCRRANVKDEFGYFKKNTRQMKFKNNNLTYKDNIFQNSEQQFNQRIGFNISRRNLQSQRFPYYD